MIANQINYNPEAPLLEMDKHAICWHADIQCFTSEYSMLRDVNPAIISHKGKRVYALNVVSSKTGEIATFTLEENAYNSEGEFTHSNYFAELPNGKKVKMVIFND